MNARLIFLCYIGTEVVRCLGYGQFVVHNQGLRAVMRTDAFA